MCAGHPRRTKKGRGLFSGGNKISGFLAYSHAPAGAFTLWESSAHKLERMMEGPGTGHPRGVGSGRGLAAPRALLHRLKEGVAATLLTPARICLTQLHNSQLLGE